MSAETDSEFETKLAALLERCKKEKIQCERGNLDGEPYVIVHLRNGRQSRPFWIWSTFEIDSVLSIPFERYTFLGDYSAIARYDQQSIEVAFTSTRGPSRHLLKLLFTQELQGDYDNVDEEQTVTLQGGNVAPSCAITIGPCTSAFHVLGRSSAGRPDRGTVTLQIKGVPISTHDDAIHTLEHLTNSLFFQIDLAKGIALTLRREPNRRRRIMPRRRETEPLPIEFPRSEFDSAPISLYWYGRSSLGMPLLQFLAFYQCVEFYFPTHFQTEQKRLIRNILKNPTFRPDREADIGRVLAAMNTPGRKGLSDEKSMLRATIHECIDAASLRSYLEENEHRQKFFANKTKGLTDIKLPIANADVDLRDSVADRIYDIRCRIVHTKSGTNDDGELLLPFSKEAQQLDDDIALLQFIAQKVLIAGSSPLRLPLETTGYQADTAEV